MADLVILVANLSPGAGTDFQLSGIAHASISAEVINWSTTVDWDESQVNGACVDAAVAAADAVGITVGPLDDKILLAGRVSL